jgi:hypothetical protein
MRNFLALPERFAGAHADSTSRDPAPTPPVETKETKPRAARAKA